MSALSIICVHSPVLRTPSVSFTRGCNKVVTQGITSKRLSYLRYLEREAQLTAASLRESRAAAEQLQPEAAGIAKRPCPLEELTAMM